MKVSELWLRALINLPESIAKLVDQLTNSGIEVDSIETVDASSAVAPLKDTVLTLKIPANRGDCLGMEGVVREVAMLNLLPFAGIATPSCLPKIKDLLSIRVKNPQNCPRYLGRIIQNVNVNVSTPDWMRERLEKAGVRLVSVAVDIMNYVMIELGQPLHAFDLNKIQEEIVVRNAVKGETLTTLDGQNIELDEASLIIADRKTPIALAGIMGGQDSAVSETTRNLFVESAYFDPIQVRLTSKRLNVRSESSHRFERGIDPRLPEKALERATELVIEIMGGNPGPVVEQSDTQYLPLPPLITLRLSKIKAVLGICPQEEIQGILERLGMKVESTSQGFNVIPPSYRVDVLTEVDVIEEIARIYGYDRIPKANPLLPLEYIAVPEEMIEEHRFKQVLVDRGYYEAITYSFLDRATAELFASGEMLLTLKNPISEELSVMRNSLWPGLLKAAQYNQRRQQSRVRLFETGLCFKESKQTSKQTSGLHAKSKIDEIGIIQKPMLAGVSLGSYYPEQWGISSRTVDFFDVKNDVEALLSLTRQPEFRFERTEHSMLHPGQSAQIISAEGEKLGVVGALHPAIVKSLDLLGPVFVFELDLNSCGKTKIPKFSELSNYPLIRRDLAILINKEVLAGELKSAIVNCVGPLVREVLIFDVYQGKGIEPGYKSVAIGLILQHPTRTLKEAEVNEQVQRVVQKLGQQFNATLRE